MTKPHKIRQHGYQTIAFLLLSVVSLGLWADVTTISQQALIDKQTAGTPLFILDVRTPEEYANGHVPNAINIPHTEIRHHISQVTQAEKEGKKVIVYCHSGRRAGYAEEVLLSSGIKKLYHLEGDMIAWTQNKRAIER